MVKNKNYHFSVEINLKIFLNIKIRFFLSRILFCIFYLQILLILYMSSCELNKDLKLFNLLYNFIL